MNVDLTSGNITGNLLKFALPLMVGNILQQFYNLADTLIVGKFLGTEALFTLGHFFDRSNGNLGGDSDWLDFRRPNRNPALFPRTTPPLMFFITNIHRLPKLTLLRQLLLLPAA